MKKYRLTLPVIISILLFILLTYSQRKPTGFSYGEYTGRERRKEIFSVNLINDLTLDRLRAQGVSVEVYDRLDTDGLYDIEFISDQTRLRYTTDTQWYIRKHADWFGVGVWGGISVYDGHIAITQNDKIYVISLPELKLEETVKIVGLPVNSVIVNSVKTENGWLVLYSAKDRQGLAPINEKGIYTGETVPLPYSYVCSYKYGENGVQTFPVSKTHLAPSKYNSDVIIYSGIGFRDAHLGGNYLINTETGWFAEIDYRKIATYQDYYEYDKYINHYILNFNTVEERYDEYNPHIMAAVAVDEGTEQILSYFTFSDDIIPDTFFEGGYKYDIKTADYIKIKKPDLYHTIIIDFNKKL